MEIRPIRRQLSKTHKATPKRRKGGAGNTLTEEQTAALADVDTFVVIDDKKGLGLTGDMSDGEVAGAVLGSLGVVVLGYGAYKIGKGIENTKAQAKKFTKGIAKVDQEEAFVKGITKVEEKALTKGIAKVEEKALTKAQKLEEDLEAVGLKIGKEDKEGFRPIYVESTEEKIATFAKVSYKVDEKVSNMVVIHSNSYINTIEGALKNQKKVAVFSPDNAGEIGKIPGFEFIHSHEVTIQDGKKGIFHVYKRNT